MIKIFNNAHAKHLSLVYLSTESGNDGMVAKR